VEPWLGYSYLGVTALENAWMAEEEATETRPWSMFEQNYRVTGYIPEGNDSNMSYSRKAGSAPFSLINSSISETSHTIVLRIIYRAGRPLRLLCATASLVIPTSVEAHDLLRGDRETTQSVSDTLVNARKLAFDPKRCEAARLNISHLPTLCQRR